MPTDAELLQRYVRERDESAFTELVRRHLGIVYGTALRRAGGRTHLAEEVAQKINSKDSGPLGREMREIRGFLKARD